MRHKRLFPGIILLLFSFILVSSAQDSPMPPGDQLLVWIGSGAQAGDQTAQNPGQLMFMDSSGTLTPISAVPLQSTRVIPCGNAATSPDGNTFAFYMGNDTGLLYIMQGTNPPVIVNDALHAMACVGNGTFQYTPDSSRFAYLDYDANVNTANYPKGWLRLYNTADASLLQSFENVTAFDINNDNAAFVVFFTDNQQLAVEAAINIWDGTTDREVATLTAEENCLYTDATIEVLPDGRLAAVMGYRCTVGDGRTQWQFYLIDPESRSATLIAGNFLPGRYFNFSRTNNIFTSSDGSVIYFTVPDGVTNYTVALATMDINTASTQIILPNQTIMPRLSQNTYANENPPPAFSRDGQWMVAVQNTPNNEATLTAIDLDAPDLPPIELSAGERGDLFSMMAITPDSSRVAYVAGATDGADNSLFALDLLTGVEFRVKRGRYGTGVMSPDGTHVAVINWQVIDDDIPPFQALALVELDTSAEQTLWQGGEIVDGDLSNQQFIYPLSWRRGS